MSLIKNILLLTLMLISSYSWCHTNSGITYGFSGGRFGDNILTVAHSVYLSHCLGLPVIYRPFPFSEYLQLSIDPSMLQANKHRKQLLDLSSRKNYLNLFKNWLNGLPSNVSILLPYYGDDVEEKALQMQVNWNDADFLQKLRNLISPLISIPTYEILPGKMSVALHVRTGVGYDVARNVQFVDPFKIPPRQYYIDALKLLHQALGSPLHIYIFTDDPDPEMVLQEFQKEFQSYPFLFSRPRKASINNLDVLEDFFSLGQFECLIRSNSNFSYTASRLFAYRAAISPEHYQRNKKNQFVIDKFLLEMRLTPGRQQPLRLYLSKPSPSTNTS